MKKLVSLLMVLSLSLALLAGCGQGQQPADEQPQEAEATEEVQEAEDADAQEGETAEGQDETESAASGDLETIVFTEQVRGYHWAPAYLAETLGYYAEEGLKAEFQTVQGMDATAPVLSGDAQFCLKGIESALMVNEKGQGMKILASLTQKYPYSLMGAGENYGTLESLRGGVVAGGQSANSGPYSFAMACMNKAGLVPEQDVSVITMASAGYAAAIANGEVQGVVSANPWSAKKLLDAGAEVIVDGTDDAAISEIIGSASYELFVVMTSDDFIESDPDTVQKTVNAIAKAIQWMGEATPEEIAANLLPLFEGAEEELLYDARYDKEHGMATTNGTHTASGFQAGIDLTKLAGGISKDYNPSAEEIYDQSFLDNAWLALSGDAS